MPHQIAEQLQRIRQSAITGASERRIETLIALLLSSLGWADRQIDQDVALSDRGTDRADIVLRPDSRSSLLIEVKRHGELRGADEQLWRYARLLRPEPRLAIVTDGVTWRIFYVGRSALLSLYEATISNNLDEQSALLATSLSEITPSHFATERTGDRLNYLNLIEDSLARLNDTEQLRLRPYFVETVRCVLQVETAIAQVDPVVQQEIPISVDTSVTSPEASPSATDSDLIILDIRHPLLKHSRMEGHIGIEGGITSWRSLVHVAVRNAVLAGLSANDIRNLTQANIREGSHTEDGFAIVTGTNVSIQAMEALRSWTTAFALVRHLALPIEVTVRWGERAGEEWQGRIGLLKWTPNT